MNGQEFLESGILMSGEDRSENAGFIPRCSQQQTLVCA